jgi:RNA-directed DNA polymerase
MPEDAPPNGGAPRAVAQGPGARVSEMQAKLHRWAAADPGRQFDDLFNLMHDPATLLPAFGRVAGNSGANTPGVDGLSVAAVEERIGVPRFLHDLRAALKDGPFAPPSTCSASGSSRQRGRGRDHHEIRARSTWD